MSSKLDPIEVISGPGEKPCLRTPYQNYKGSDTYELSKTQVSRTPVSTDTLGLCKFKLNYSLNSLKLRRYQDKTKIVRKNFSKQDIKSRMMSKLKNYLVALIHRQNADSHSFGKDDYATQVYLIL